MRAGAGGDDTVDDDGDGFPDDCVGETCADTHERFPSAPSGLYTVDPDGPGGLDPYEAWCDMEVDGGGWMLVMKRVRAVTDVAIDGPVLPSMTSRVVRDDRWQVLRDVAVEALGVVEGLDPAIAQMATLRAANCKPLAMSLTDAMLASNENSGCTGYGNDYSQWFGFRNELGRNMVLWNTSSTSMYVGGGNSETASGAMYVR